MLLLSIAAADADLLPSPNINELCRHADLIVEGERLEGPGDRVRIVQVFKSPSGRKILEQPIAVRGIGRMDRDVAFTRNPKRIETQRAVLFLRRGEDDQAWEAIFATEQGSPGVFWYDDEACYGYEQIMNPGPYCLVVGRADAKRWDVPADRDELVKRIKTGLRVDRQWEAILALEDPKERAAGLARYLLPHTAPEGYADDFRPELRERLGDLGADAVPALVDVLEKAGPEDNLNATVLILYDIGSIATHRGNPSPTGPAVPALRRLLREPGKTSRYYVLSAIRGAADPSLIPDVRRYLDDPDKQVAEAAAETIKALKAAAANQ